MGLGEEVVGFFVSHLTVFYLKQETRVTVRSGYRVTQTTEENNKHTDSKPLESEKGNVASTKTKSIIFPEESKVNERGLQT